MPLSNAAQLSVSERSRIEDHRERHPTVVNFEEPVECFSMFPHVLRFTIRKQINQVDK